MEFPVSGVEVSPLVPPLVAFAVSCLTASAGLSGAFLLLPFQMSVLGYVTPGVSATNLIFNLVAIPGGAYRYARERRMLWPLAGAIVAGTLPGVFIGAWVRVHYLADPRHVRLFVGLVLLYLAARLLTFGGEEAAGPPPKSATIRVLSVSPAWIKYSFGPAVYGFRPAAMLALALGVGLAGGIYGVGGGAVIAPFAVATLRLPVHTVAGAALLGTFATSAAGVGFFHLFGARPDWLLGALFGLGGLAGTYAGARLQKHLPARWIRLFCGILVGVLGLLYVSRLGGA